MGRQRSSWKSNIGFLLAAIGSAIGLGNIWRFSYMAHQYGGGAFLVPYFVALIIAGVPIMIIEYGLGHREKGSSPLSFVRINSKFEWLGWWMPVVAMFGIIFFLMLVIAGLTSGISLIEAFACAITDKFDWPRRKVVTAVCVLGFLGSLVFTTRAGLYLLDIADHFITNYGLVVGGLLECLIIGWVLKASVLRKHVSRLGTVVPPLWDILVKFITPAILIYLLYLSLAGDFAENYSGYPTGQLILYGVGWMFVCFVVALVLTFIPWKSEKLKRLHRPEEDELLI